MTWLAFTALLLVPVPAADADVFLINKDASRVERRDATGKVVWSTLLDGRIGSVRPPDIQHDAERVYVTHEDGVTALDAKKGVVLWRSNGVNHGLHLSGGLLLATGSTPAEGATPLICWFVAREVAKGTEVFKIRLPAKYTDSASIEEVAGLFLVQAWGLERAALLFDRDGKVRHRFDRNVVCGKRLDKDIVFLTSADVVRVDADDRSIWSIPFEREGSFDVGWLVELPGGELIAFKYDCICDSGAHATRINPTNGKCTWKSHCSGLRISHSKYSHRASVAVAGDQLRVTSQGSSGKFVEVLDLDSGHLVERSWSIRSQPDPGSFVTLPSGDLVRLEFGRVKDAGVDIKRLDPTGEKVIWKTHCEGIRVEDSKVSQDATVAIEGTKVRVTSRGSYGRFVVVLDLASGRRIEEDKEPVK